MRGASWPGDVDVPRPHATGDRLGGVDPRAVRRQGDAVGVVEAVDELGDRRAVGRAVVHAGLVLVTSAGLAEIGEVEAALVVEHDVVRPAQRVAAALRVDVLDRPGVDVDALDAAADVVGRLRAGGDDAVELVPLEAAVVADVDLAVGSDRGAVGAAARRGDARDGAVRAHRRQRPGLDLDDEHPPVLEPDRPLRELQALSRSASSRSACRGP